GGRSGGVRGAGWTPVPGQVHATLRATWPRQRCTARWPDWSVYLRRGAVLAPGRSRRPLRWCVGLERLRRPGDLDGADRLRRGDRGRRGRRTGDLVVRRGGARAGRRGRLATQVLTVADQGRHRVAPRRAPVGTGPRFGCRPCRLPRASPQP